MLHDPRLASNSSLIQRPEKSHLLRIQYRRALTELQSRRSAASGEPATQSPGLDEIARYLGMAPSALEQERLSESEQAPFQTLGGLRLADRLVPDLDLVKNEDRALVFAALRRLNPFEAWVICERFGLSEPSGRGPRQPARRGEIARASDNSPEASASTTDAVEESGRFADAYFQRSYIDIGSECGLSVFRLRQVEKTALDRLRELLAQRAAEEM